MAFQSDFRVGRTWDDERELELIYQPVRDARTFKILKNGNQVAAFVAYPDGRELTDEEKRKHPGFGRALVWHVQSRGGKIDDPKHPDQNILDEVIVDALSSFQGIFGVTSFRDGKPIHALVTVEFSGSFDATL